MEGDKEIVAGEKVVMVVPTAKKSAKAPEFNKTGIAAKGMGGEARGRPQRYNHATREEGDKGAMETFPGPGNRAKKDT